MKLVKRTNESIHARYDGPVEVEEFDFEEFEPGDIVVARTSPNTIQVVRKVNPTRTPYNDSLVMDTLWRLDPGFTSTKKTEPSTRYRLASREEVQDAITRLGEVLQKLSQ